MALGIGAVLALVGCIPPPPPAPVGPMTIGVNHTVGVRQITFVDSTRATDAFGSYPGSSSRRLPTTIWYPTDGGGPYPLVVFAHGYAVTPSYYASLLPRLAAAGYVVAAPTYPLLSGQPAGPTDTVGWHDLFADTWFVTSRMLDPRVRAVVAYAADLGALGIYQPNGRPILHVLSDNDEYNPYAEAINWDRAHLQSPKYTVTLRDATHAAPYTTPTDPHFNLVTRVTIAFLDATLKAHPEAMDAATADIATHPSLAAIE